MVLPEPGSAWSRAAFASELTDCVAELVAKYHDASAPGGRRFRLVTVAHPRPHTATTDTPIHPDSSPANKE